MFQERRNICNFVVSCLHLLPTSERLVSVSKKSGQGFPLRGLMGEETAAPPPHQWHSLFAKEKFGYWVTPSLVLQELLFKNSLIL